MKIKIYLKSYFNLKIFELKIMNCKPRTIFRQTLSSNFSINYKIIIIKFCIK